MVHSDLNLNMYGEIIFTYPPNDTSGVKLGIKKK